MATAMRRVAAEAAAGERMPVYVQAHQGHVARNGETLRVETPEAPPRLIPLDEVAELVLMGNVAVTTPCLHALFRRGVPVTWCSADGWPLGRSFGSSAAEVGVRREQYAVAADPARGTAVARALVAAKIRNGRTLLRRSGYGRFSAELAFLDRLVNEAERAPSVESLLGIEGTAAARHFAALGGLIAKGRGGKLAAAFSGRRKRPPTDPVNAVLSFGYALLARLCERGAADAGFDPALGFLHQARDGRPALALDLMEPWRPVLVDALALRLFAQGRLSAADFVTEEGAVLLGETGRRSVIAAFEARLDQGEESVTRSAVASDARALARHLVTGAPFEPFLWR